MQSFYEYNRFDSEGKQVVHVVKGERSKLGKGWIAMFKEPMLILVKSLKPSQLRMFLALSLKANYEPYVVITVQRLCKIVGLSYKPGLEAVHDLEELKLVRRVRVDGVQVFILNPKYTVCGATGKKRRDSLWQLLDRRDSIAKALSGNVIADEYLKGKQMTMLARIDNGIAMLLDGKEFDESALEDDTPGNVSGTGDPTKQEEILCVHRGVYNLSPNDMDEVQLSDETRGKGADEKRSE